MQKMGGRICDACRKLFYYGDPIIELCEKCVNQVWIVINIYEDNFRELAAVCHTEETAKEFVEKSKTLIKKLNKDSKIKLIKQDISNWVVL